MKVCTKCGIEKNDNCFNFDLRKGRDQEKRLPRCRECSIEYSKNYNKKNKEELNKRQREYHNKNSIEINKNRRERFRLNSGKVKEKQRIWEEKNKEKRRAQQKLNQTAEKKRKKQARQTEKRRETGYYSRRYQENKSYFLEKQKRRKRERMETDSFYRFKVNIRKLISASIKQRGFSKKTQSFQIVGCTFEELLDHLIKTAIKNYGYFHQDIKYEVDHIYPMSFCKNEEDATKLNHFTNLQYLLPYHNSLKSNKLDFVLPPPKWTFPLQTQEEQDLWQKEVDTLVAQKGRRILLSLP